MSLPIRGVKKKRKAEDEEWEDRKDEITSLYKEHKKIKKVREIMSSNGFERTQHQYVRRLSKWTNGIRKNVNESEWKYINQQIVKRRSEGKASMVKKHGYEVAQSTIDKQGKKHAYQTQLERYGQQSRYATPPGIEVYTPHDREQSATVVLPIMGEYLIQITHHFPWLQFATQFDLLTRFNGGITSMSPDNTINLLFLDPSNLNNNLELFTRSTVLYQDLSQNWLARFREEVSVPGSTAAFSKRQYQPHRPHVGEKTGESNLDVTITSTQLQLLKYAVGFMSNNNCDEILLVQILILAGDKHNLKFLGRFLSMKQISTDAFAERLLQGLLHQKYIDLNLDLLKVLLSSGADANATNFLGMSLLETACVYTRDIAPCQLLLEMGADVNYVDDIYDTPLSLACLSGNDAAAELFLEHGAYVNIPDQRNLYPLAHAMFNCSSTTITRLLDHADFNPNQIPSVEKFIAQFDYSKAKRILEFDTIFEFYRSRTTVATFINAACNGEIELLNIARTLRPMMFEKLKETPWVLFEAAAFGLRRDELSERSDAKTIAAVDYLQKEGFDIRSVDKSGRGNPVVFAILNGRVKLAQHLLKTGVRAGSFANGDWILSQNTSHLVPGSHARLTIMEVLGVIETTPRNWRHYKAFICEKSDRAKNFLRNYIKHIAPIHAAAVCENDPSGQLIPLLLSQGADPNQTSAESPFQSADLVDTQFFTALQIGSFQKTLTAQLNLGVCCYHSKQMPCFLVPNPLQMTLRGDRVEPFRYLLNAGAKLPDTMYATGCCTCVPHVSVHTTSVDNPLPLQKNVGINFLKDTVDQEFWNGEPGHSRLGHNTKTDFVHNNNSYGTEERVYVMGNPHTDDNRCPYNDEWWWNPLFHVKEKKIFCEVFTTMSSTHHELWVTRIISSRVANACKWDLVSRLIDNGIIPEEHAYQQDFFVKSICAKDESWVKRILEKGNLPQNTAQLGFIIAAQRGHKSLVKTFLKSGYWPEEKVKTNDLRDVFQADIINESNGSPLSVALSLKNDKLIRIFTDYYRAKSDERHSSDYSSHFAQAYGEAIVQGNIEIAKLLMHEGRVNDVIYISRELGWTGNGYVRNCITGPYHDCEPPIRKFHSSVQLAAAYGQYDVVRWLLAQGANPHIPDEKQNSLDAYHSPLQCAARDKEVEIVQTLIEKGAKVNDEPILLQGATALQFAAKSGDFRLVEILLQAGADVNAMPCLWDGRSAIEGAAEWGRLDIVSLLLAAEADMKGRGNINYRLTVYRAWAHGHRVLARMIQRWKQEKYGPADVEPIDLIIDSMDVETLEHPGRSALDRPVCYYTCYNCRRTCRH